MLLESTPSSSDLASPNSSIATNSTSAKSFGSAPLSNASRETSDWQSRLRLSAEDNPLFRRRQIVVSGTSGRVVLTGVVTSYYEKQLAQEFVRRIDGVELIDNRIEVN